MGGGMRIYTTHDDVYEMREDSGVSTRIYPGGGRWAVKMRFPVTDAEDGYDVVRDVLAALDAEGYTPTPKAFTDDIKDDGTATIKTGGGTVRYADDVDLDAMVDIDIDRSTKLKGALAGVAAESGTLGAVGAAIGGALGIPGGPPAMAAGATAGSAVGGGLGVLAGGLEAPMALRTWEDRDLPVERVIYRMQQRRKRKFLNGRFDAFEKHLDAVNRMRSYERRLEEAESLNMEVRELYDSYVEGGRREQHDALFDVHFHRFHHRDGVTVSASADTYREAVETAADILDTPVHDVERPSIYADRDVFAALFTPLTYQDEQEVALSGSGENLLEDAEILVANVFDRDAIDPGIAAWLEETYPDAVREVGQERSMER